MAKRASTKSARKSADVVEYTLPEQELKSPAPVPMSAIIGQDRACGILCNAIRSKRVHHAWIFHGPHGAGKFTTALSFAALLLDDTIVESNAGLYSAGRGSTAQALLATGSHPDLHIIVKELARYHEEKSVRDKKLTSIPIDVVRDFLLGPGNLNATVRSDALAAKVFIVDEAELLNTASQNAVLKFLEEPPERTVVILVTSAEERLLPTIRSRCQRVFFSALGDREMAQWEKSSAPEVAPEEREWLRGFAGGLPGVYCAAAEAGLFAWQQRIQPLLARSITGQYCIELGSGMAELVDAWAKNHVETVENASKEAANKAGADWMFRLVAYFLQSQLRRGAGAAALHGLDAVRRAESEIDSNVSALFVFEKLAGELANEPAGG